MNRITKLFLILLFAFSCNNEEDVTNPIDEGEPAVTEIGMPIGDGVTKEIGPAGGSISSADGKLDITVPPGAVTANTTFSIQPISNFCPGGYNAYQLLPEGLTFGNPVTLIFHYTDEDLEGTSTDFLGIAFQGPDQIWYRMPSTIDEVAKTIATEAKHFTHWTRLSQLAIAPITPAVPELDVNESLNLVLTGAGDISPQPQGVESPNPTEDDLPSLPIPVPFVAKWYVNGVENGNPTVGWITISSDRVNVTYHAPAKPPANNPVAISAELTEFRAWDIVNKRRKSFNKVLLFKHVKIRPTEYNFKLKLEWEYYSGCHPDQRYYDMAQMDVHVEDGIVEISNPANQDPSINPNPIQVEDCTLTCLPGVGLINIASADGGTFKDPETSEPYLRIGILNKGGILVPGYTSTCGDGDVSKPQPDHTYAAYFPLRDDTTQIIDVVFKWTLTPE
jgi:hypothetical protein